MAGTIASSASAGSKMASATVMAASTELIGYIHQVARSSLTTRSEKRPS